MPSRGSSDASSPRGHAAENNCRVNLHAWLPHNLFNSGSSTYDNNNHIIIISNNDNPMNLDGGENSRNSGGPPSSFPMLPHEIVRSSRGSLGSSTSDEVAGVPGGGVNGIDVSLLVEVRRVQEYVYDPYADELDDESDIYTDMRLDVDHMSYEELLALEERIGSVSIGVSREKARCSLRKLKCDSAGSGICCICQEDYAAADDLGKLKCDHVFHMGCIEQWLLQKNVCPICKSMAI